MYWYIDFKLDNKPDVRITKVRTDFIEDMIKETMQYRKLDQHEIEEIIIKPYFI